MNDFDVPAPTRALDRFGVVAILILCLSWGLNQTAAKYALSEITPLLQAALRSGVGAVIVCAYAFWRDVHFYRRDGSLAGGLACGVVFALQFMALYVGLQWTTASHAVLFLYSAPFVTALGLPYVTPGESLTRRQWLGLLVSFFGLALAMGVAFGDPNMLLGDALALLAGIGWGASTLIVKGTRLGRATPEKILLYQLVISALLLGALALARGEKLSPLSPSVALAFAYQAIWVVGVTFIVWFWLVGQYRAAELSAFTFMAPLFGVASGHIILGDPIGAQFLIAATLVAAGVLIVNWP